MWEPHSVGKAKRKSGLLRIGAELDLRALGDKRRRRSSSDSRAESTAIPAASQPTFSIDHDNRLQPSDGLTLGPASFQCEKGEQRSEPATRMPRFHVMNLTVEMTLPKTAS